MMIMVRSKMEYYSSGRYITRRFVREEVVVPHVAIKRVRRNEPMNFKVFLGCGVGGFEVVGSNYKLAIELTHLTSKYGQHW